MTGNTRAKLRLARAISAVCHPMAMVPAAILVAGSRSKPLSEVLTTIAIVGGALLLIGVYVVRGVRSGRFADLDVTRREERPPTLRLALLATAGVFVILRARGQTGAGPLGAMLTLGTAALLNHRLKVSMHTGFSFYAAALVATWPLGWFWLFAVMAVAVAWSRLALARHTLPEVLVGGAAGTVGGLIARWF